MSRESFRRELDSLVGEVASLGREVERCLETMTGALGGQDGGASRRVIGMDRRYKGRGAEIDEACMLLQARQAPVAGDLRLIYAIQAVTNHLVRTGTLCEHVCRFVAETAGAGEERDREVEMALYEMARTAGGLFGEGLSVFERRDAERARDLAAADDTVDLLYTLTINLLVAPGRAGDSSLEWRVRAALVVHYLERIADHGVEIGRRTLFIVTGEHIRSTTRRRYRKRDQDE